MKITTPKIIVGCLGTVALCGCLGYALYVVFLLHAIFKIHLYEDAMHEPELRESVERLIYLEFPASVEWGKSKYTRQFLDHDFNCDFTLPKKDIDLMFPPDKVTWQENNLDMLPQWSKDWLKEKNLDHFKVAEYRPTGSIVIVVDNPPEIDEDQRVWVYIGFVWD